MKYTVYDIETGPLPLAEIESAIPPFDPSEVKVGNIKDPEKIAAKIAEVQAAQRQAFFDNAALNPMTGQVLAIGCSSSHGHHIIDTHEHAECVALSMFWTICQEEIHANRCMVGFNSNQFDLPFLIRRSWHLRIPVPQCIRKGRYWSDQLIDLRDTWQLGDRMAHGSLDSISRFLGVGAKTGDGKDFANLWTADREKALAYLRNDLDLTAKVAAILLGE
jgi:hypothetical protein